MPSTWLKNLQTGLLRAKRQPVSRTVRQRREPQRTTPADVQLLEDRALLAAFTAGNLAIYRIGDGSAALSNASTATFVDEYTPAGTFVQTIAMPTADSGANQTLTNSGNSTSEGFLTLSTDGQYLTVGGYDAAPGVASIAGTSTASTLRVIGRVDAAGTVDTSTTTTAFSAGNIRSVTSTNGTDLWATGSNTGLVHTTFGGSGAGTIVSNSPTANLRVGQIFNGQLYTTSGSGTLRLGTVGTGTPTTTGQTVTNLPGFPTAGSQYGYFFADLDAGVAGLDTVYVADDGAGLTKYSLVSGSWTANGTVGVNADDYRAVTGSVSGGTVTLYATRDSGSGADTIVSLVDTSGYNGTFSATPTAIVTASNANQAFRGIAFAPQNAGGGNTVPVATASSVTTNEDTAKTFAVADFSFTDTENDSLASITVGTLSLATGDTLTVDQGAGPIAVTNGMTITAAQIATLTYTPLGNANGNARSTFTFTVNDASGNGTVAATMTINVTAVNDVPSASPSSVTTNEDTTKTFAVADFLFTDVETDTLVSITVGTLSLASGDTLTVDQGAGPIAVTNGMTITAAQIPTLTYTPLGNASGNARSTFTFTVNDAGLGTVADTMTINVTAVNDVPSANPSSVTTNEDTAKTFAAADFLFSDVENDSLVSITVGTLSLASGDTLTVDQGAGPVAVTNGMTITAAQIPTLTYTPLGNANGNARSTFTFTVNDAGLGTVADTMSIDVTAVNDVPSASPSSVTTNEDTAKTFAVADFLFSDVENDSLVSITLGTLSLASGDTLTVDQGAGPVAVTNGMTITAAQIPTLTYTPLGDANGNARSTFTFTVNDAGLGTVADTLTIDVTAVNDVPTANASSVTTDEDTAKTFAVGDFLFGDVENDSLVSITVSNLALASGDTLTVDQGAGPVAVTNGMTITAAQIATLIYTPVPGLSGMARSTFDFTVNDAGLGTVAATMTINVNDVNDAPTIGGALANQATTDDSTITPFATLTVTDPDTQALKAIVRINNGAFRGDFTAASSTGWTRSTIGNVIQYVRDFAAAANNGANVESAIRALVFQPRSNAIKVGTTETTTFTVTVGDSVATPATNSTTSVVTTSKNDTPTIGGAVANQAVNDTATLNPFSTLTVTDPDVQAMSAKVTIKNGVVRGDFTAASTAGWTRTVTGNNIIYSRYYAVQADVATTVQAAIRGFVFQPLENAIKGGTTASTLFTVYVTDGTSNTTDSTTSVAITSVNDAPVIAGALGNQQVNSDSVISPFNTVTVTDPDTQDMLVKVTIKNGVFRGDFTAASSTGWTRQVVGNKIVYTRYFSTTANIGATAQAAIRALVFQPRAGVAVGATEATAFDIFVNDGIANATDSATLVTTTGVGSRPAFSFLDSDTTTVVLPTVKKSKSSTGWILS